MPHSFPLKVTVSCVTMARFGASRRPDALVERLFVRVFLVGVLDGVCVSEGEAVSDAFGPDSEADGSDDRLSDVDEEFDG